MLLYGHFKSEHWGHCKFEHWVLLYVCWYCWMYIDAFEYMLMIILLYVCWCFWMYIDSCSIISYKCKLCCIDIKLVVYFSIMCTGGTQTKKGKLKIIIASLIIETWATCAKRVVGHYYESCLVKHKVAWNRKYPNSCGSENWLEREE